MLGMYRVIDPKQMNRLQVGVGEKHERRLSFGLELQGCLMVLRLDYPDGRARFKCWGVFDQLPELVVAPRSPLAAHKDEYERLAPCEFCAQRVQFSRFLGKREIRSLAADGWRRRFGGMFYDLFHARASGLA